MNFLPFRRAVGGPPARQSPPSRTVRRLRASESAIAIGLECLPLVDPVELRRLHRYGRGRVFGAFEGPTLTGYVLAQSLGPAIVVRQLAVLPEHRRRGHGRALLRHLETAQPREGFYRSTNATVRETDLDAQLFFRACGWRCEAATATPQGDLYLFRNHLGGDEE